MSSWIRSKICGGDAAGYADNWAHLSDELAYVDQLVRAETVRWRRALASDFAQKAILRFPELPRPSLIGHPA